MTLSLNGLSPIPLQEHFSRRQSDVWLQSLQFEQGETVLLLAPSGSGKTTLLHILYGIRTDYDGAVSWGHGTLKKMSPESLALLRTQQVSIVFQDLRLFPQLSLLENLELKRSLTNTISRKEMKTWLIRLGLSDKQDTPAHTLSYGEQQRAAIIRSLLQPFRWLLMDEPFSHLDPDNIHAALTLIKEVVERNKAGLLLAALEENLYFDYTKTIRL